MIKSFLLLGFLVVAVVPVQAASNRSSALVTITDLGNDSFDFSQDGWQDGGAVTGNFTGFDSDGDGQLNSQLGEITGFSMTFSGNDNVESFSLGLQNLRYLAYDLDGGALGQGLSGGLFEGIWASGGTGTFVSGPGIFAVCGYVDTCAVVSDVPEPSSWTMLIAGFGLTGATLRRRRYRLA